MTTEKDAGEGPASEDMTPVEFGRLFKRFTFWLDEEYFEATPTTERKFIADRLRGFLRDIQEIPAIATLVVSERDIPNIHLALTSWMEGPGAISRVGRLAG